MLFYRGNIKWEDFFLRMLWENHIWYVNSEAKTCSAFDSLRRLVYVLLGFENNRNYLVVFAFPRMWENSYLKILCRNARLF